MIYSIDGRGAGKWYLFLSYPFILPNKAWGWKIFWLCESKSNSYFKEAFM